MLEAQIFQKMMSLARSSNVAEPKFTKPKDHKSPAWEYCNIYNPRLFPDLVGKDRLFVRPAKYKTCVVQVRWLGSYKV